MLRVKRTVFTLVAAVEVVHAMAIDLPIDLSEVTALVHTIAMFLPTCFKAKVVVVTDKVKRLPMLLATDIVVVQVIKIVFR